jgi:hypothetical protein
MLLIGDAPNLAMKIFRTALLCDHSCTHSRDLEASSLLGDYITIV